MIGVLSTTGTFTLNPYFNTEIILNYLTRVFDHILENQDAHET